MESILWKISTPWSILVQAALWTVLLILTVALASFAPEMAFMSKLSLSSDGFVKIPMNLPEEMVIVPSEMIKKSALDLFYADDFRRSYGRCFGFFTPIMFWYRKCCRY